MSEIKAEKKLAERDALIEIFGSHLTMDASAHIKALVNQADYASYKALTARFSPQLVFELNEAKAVARSAVFLVGETKCKDCTEEDYQQFAALRRRLEKLGVEL